jgi:hypothetical protein
MAALVTLGMKKKGINLEAMPTEDAIATYNYLCAEERLVVACLIPPEQVQHTQGSDADTQALLEIQEFGVRADTSWYGKDPGDDEQDARDWTEFQERLQSYTEKKKDK